MAGLRVREDLTKTEPLKTLISIKPSCKNNDAASGAICRFRILLKDTDMEPAGVCLRAIRSISYGSYGSQQLISPDKGGSTFKKIPAIKSNYVLQRLSAKRLQDPRRTSFRTLAVHARTWHKTLHWLGTEPRSPTQHRCYNQWLKTKQKKKKV